MDFSFEDADKIVTFLLSSIYLSILKQDNDIFFKFNRLLNDKQKIIYQNIVKERLKIYTIAMFTGLGSGLLYWYRNQKQPYIWCSFLAIVYIVKLA